MVKSGWTPRGKEEGEKKRNVFVVSNDSNLVCPALGFYLLLRGIVVIVRAASAQWLAYTFKQHACRKSLTKGVKLGRRQRGESQDAMLDLAACGSCAGVAACW